MHSVLIKSMNMKYDVISGGWKRWIVSYTILGTMRANSSLRFQQIQIIPMFSVLIKSINMKYDVISDGWEWWIVSDIRYKNLWKDPQQSVGTPNTSSLGVIHLT